MIIKTSDMQAQAVDKIMTSIQPQAVSAPLPPLPRCGQGVCGRPQRAGEGQALRPRALLGRRLTAEWPPVCHPLQSRLR